MRTKRSYANKISPRQCQTISSGFCSKFFFLTRQCKTTQILKDNKLWVRIGVTWQVKYRSLAAKSGQNNKHEPSFFNVIAAPRGDR